MVLRSILEQKWFDELYGQRRYRLENAVVEIIFANCHIRHRINVRRSHERRQPRQSANQGIIIIMNPHITVPYNSQHITDHTDAPHIRIQSDLIEVHHLGRNELGGAKQHLQRFARIVPSGHSKVNDFNAIATTRHAQHVFRLQIEVYDFARMQKLHTFAYLARKYAARFLRQKVILLNDALEEFATADAMAADRW